MSAGGLAVGPDATWLANQIFVQGTAIALVAAAAVRLLRHHSAAARSGVWALAVAALALGPLLSTIGPEPGPAAGPVTAASPSVRMAPSTEPGATALRAEPRTVQDRPRRPLPGPPGEWVWLWLVTSAAALVALLRDVRALRLLRAGCLPPDPSLRARFEAVRRQVAPRRVVEVALHPELRVPILIGGRRPVVVVPASARAWPSARLESAFRHELAHLARHDLEQHLVARVVLGMYALNPATWLVRRGLEVERERACDDRVIGWGTPASEYAAHLLEVARAGRARPWSIAPALSGAGGIGARIGAVLAPGPRRSWGPVGWGAAIAVALATTAVTAGFQLMATPDEVRRADALERLASDDAEQRRHGAWMLGELETSDGVEPLLAALADPVVEVRLAAAWALGEIKDGAAGPALADALADPDGRVREVAALSLGELEDPTAIEALTAAAERDPALGPAAAWAVSQIGGVALARGRGLPTETVRATDPDLWIGGPADGRGDAGSIEALLDDLGAAAPERRRAAALALGTRGSEDVVDALLARLSDEDPSVRAAAVWALDEINPSRR